MKIVDANRYDIYSLIKQCYNKLDIDPTIIEIGVCRGTNSEHLIRSLQPQSTFLVDEWRPYSPYKDAAVGSHMHNITSGYFGGPVDDIQTYENLYAECQSKFVAHPNTIILRQNSLLAAYDLYQLNFKFDFIYIDASHLYEDVIQDLIHYEKLLSENGVIMLDDFVNAKEVEVESLGVVNAVIDFLKINPNYQPVMITKSTAEAWPNILLVRKDSAMSELVSKQLVQSAIFFVEIPDDLLGFVESNPHQNYIKFN
jgi:hypothetical protein